MERLFTMEVVEHRLGVALLMTNPEPLGTFVSKDFSLSLRESLEMNHVVMEWVLAQRSEAIRIKILRVNVADKENISLLDEFWTFLSEHDVSLTVEDKIALYQDFLDD